MRNLAFSFALAALAAAASAQYRIAPLAIPEGDVNPAGIAGGYIVGNTQTDAGVVSTLWSPNGSTTPLTMAPGTTLLGFAGVNRLGVAVGTAGGARMPPKGMVWRDGAMTFLATQDADGDEDTLYGSRALAINDAGTIIGGAETAFGTQGVVWDGDDIRLLMSLNPLDEYQQSSARAINASGQIAGSADLGARPQAVVWGADGGVTRIGGLGEYSYANALNDRGVAVGSTIGEDVSVGAFLYDGTTHLLPTLTGRVYSDAFGINNAGLVVGAAAYEGNDEGTAVLWRDGTAYDLNRLVDLPDWQLISATGIDDDGTIVGFGRYKGEVAGFRLTPVPEPASMAALGLGLAAVARRRRSRSK